MATEDGLAIAPTGVAASPDDKVYARIQDGVVFETLTTPNDITEMFPPEYQWVDVTSVAGVSQSWVLDKGGNVVPPPAVVMPTMAKNDLLAYAEEKQKSIEISGVSVNVGTPSAAVIIAADTGQSSQIDLLGIFVAAQLDPAFTTSWVDGINVTVLTAAQSIILAKTVRLFINSTYTALAMAITGIQDGSITTTAQIDAIKWPVNS